MSLFSQKIDNLSNYLKGNCFPVNIDSDNEISIINDVMKEKKIFILGEGGSHYLNLNNRLRILLIRHFSRHNLKSFLMESGRSNAYLFNEYLKDPLDSGQNITWDSLFMNQLSVIKNIYNNGYKFEYRGIDMERYGLFRKAVEILYKKSGIDEATLNQLPLLKSILTDTSYISSNDWIKNETSFLKVYRNYKNSFYEDSLFYKKYLGNQYLTFRYLITNSHTKNPLQNRNQPMANNLLEEIVPIDIDSATYVLDVGAAHSQRIRDIVNSTNAKLNNRVVVMNVYCDSCLNKIETPSNWMLPEIKGAVLEAFRNNAQKNNITIFDIRNLPDDFIDLKRRCDLILFARKQD